MSGGALATGLATAGLPGFVRDALVSRLGARSGVAPLAGDAVLALRP